MNRPIKIVDRQWQDSQPKHKKGEFWWIFYFKIEEVVKYSWDLLRVYDFKCAMYVYMYVSNSKNYHSNFLYFYAFLKNGMAH
jgi:hypothetical protein